MEEQQNLQQPRHHKVESLSLHVCTALSTTFSPTVTSWCKLLVPCAAIGLHTGVQRHSVFKLRVQPTDSAIRSQASAGPTRNITGDVVSATLAEAVTKLSFAEFLERCNLSRAHPPRPLPIATLLLDAATQTFPHIAVSHNSRSEFSLRCVHPQDPSGALVPPSTHDVICPTCSRPPPLPLDAAVQTPARSVASADVTTQLLPTELVLSRVHPNDLLDRQGSSLAHCNAGSAPLPQPIDITTIFSCTSDRHVSTTAPRAAPLCATAATRSRGSSPLELLTWNPCQSSPASHKRSASATLAGTHHAICADPRAGGTWTFSRTSGPGFLHGQI